MKDKNIQVTPEIHKALRQLAADKGKKLREVVDSILRKALKLTSPQ